MQIAITYFKKSKLFFRQFQFQFNFIDFDVYIFKNVKCEIV